MADPTELVAEGERLLRISDVADRLGLSRASVYSLVARAELGSVKLGGARRVRESELNRFIASLEAA